MFGKLWLLLLCTVLVGRYASAQTTTGLMTGVITDSSGAVIPGAAIDVTNQATGEKRIATTGGNGIYLIVQVQPGVYSISVKKQGFTPEKRNDIQLAVNQSVTIDFKLGVSPAAQTVIVSGAAPLLNTTSSTLSDVIDHEAAVDLPLNGRNFVQLALLTAGAVPLAGGQQTTYTIAEGSGAVSPAVNGQQGLQNNYTMDGVLNNSVYINTWVIAPPPEAIQEFNIQSHITDAQFAISTGANINVVTRSGTNALHGDMWEFLRNNAFDADTFPAKSNLPYHQSQYGLYLGGPVILPHIFNGKNNTWFALYWEGFRYSKTVTTLADTLTTNMVNGNFSGELGTKVIGTDCLGRPEYADEIYDPETSRPDSCHPGSYLRDPFMYNGQLNVIPPNRINPASAIIAAKYYPAPNLDVADSVLPNYSFPGTTSIKTDIFGIRLDHQFTPNDTVFLRFNRTNQHESTPEPLPSDPLLVEVYAQQAALGYTHIFNPQTILNFRYGYTYGNTRAVEEPAGEGFDNAINFTQSVPSRNNVWIGPDLVIGNGFSTFDQVSVVVGPQEDMDYHLDLSKIVGRHYFGAGVMFSRLLVNTGSWDGIPEFEQNATAQDATAGPTGYSPASFILGFPHTYVDTGGKRTVNYLSNWYAYYAQDQWQATNHLVLVAGLRWDYVAPAKFDSIVSALDVFSGQYLINKAYLPLFPNATAPSGYFYPQYNGYEPRFGISYNPLKRTVIHSAFAILDDHNDTNAAKNSTMLGWPASIIETFSSLDLGVPTMSIDNLTPATSLISTSAPVASFAGDPHDKMPYSMQYNLGVQQQVSNLIAVKVDYVGSASRHQLILPEANTALTPGPGAIAARQPYPQYGGPVGDVWNGQPATYNSLHAEVKEALSTGSFFLASYTWQKAMDWQSNPNSTNREEDFYNMKAEWGPSQFSIKHMFVWSSNYALPVGRGKTFWRHANRLTDEIVGGWNLGGIVSLRSGTPFQCVTGADTANVGDTVDSERCNRVPGVRPYASSQTHLSWLNKAAFTLPAAYTYGTESRDDLSGPAYRDADVVIFKNFPLYESQLQFRAEAFNLLNMTNYTIPFGQVLSSASFGSLASASPGRELQFALKLMF